MSVKIAPSPRQQFVDANGVPYSGAKLFTYAAGSTTKQTTYTDSTGITPNTNPIVLDSAGRTPYGRWYTAGLAYKEVLAPSTDTDPPTSPIFTEDNISGVNDTSVATSQWVASGLTPTYIGATQFSVVGDQTTELHVNRRVKLTVSAGTVYGKISVSAYTTLTTVTVVLDSGSLDSGLSVVELSILSANNSAVPAELRGTTFSGLVNLAAGADIASAATINLTAATGNCPRITGTTPTSAVTMNTGQQMLVVANGAWPLTYHATTNKLSTGASYTCVAGDKILYHKDLSGVVHGQVFKVGPATGILSFTRSMTAASGDVAYSGLGFKPSVLQMTFTIDATSTIGMGLATPTAAGNVSQYGANLWASDTTYVVRAYVDANNEQRATVASWDPDGFTLTWTKTLLPTGTLNVKCVAWR